MPAPNFGGVEWPKAKKLFKKRDALMHPKTPDEMNVDDAVWDEIYNGLLWLMNEIFCFPDYLNNKYSLCSGRRP